MKTKNQDENIHIGKLLASLLPHWKTAALICGLSLTIGTIFWSITPKEYQTTATMLLVSEQQDLSAQMRLIQMAEFSGLLGQSQNGIHTDDQIALIASTEILGKTIRDLNLQTVIKTESGRLGFALYNNSPLSVEFPKGFPTLPVNGVTFKVTLKTAIKAQMEFNTGWFGSTQTDVKELPATFNTPYGEIKLQPNRNHNPTDLDKLYIQLTPFEKCYEEYKELISINAMNSTSSILKLEMEGRNRELNSDILSSLINNYNLYTDNQKREDRELNDRFVEERLQAINKELSEHEGKIVAFKEQHKLTHIETDIKLNLTASESYKTKQNELEIQIKLLEYVLDYLDNPSNNQSVIPVVLAGSDKESPVAAEIAVYNNLIAQQSKLQQVSGRLNPALVTVTKEINRQRNHLIETIKTYRQSIDLSIKELNKTNAQYNQRIGSLPSKEQEYLEIKRQQIVKEALLVFLLQKREEYSMSSNHQQVSGKTVDTPYHSSKHTYPKGSIVLPVSLILGMIVSLLVIFVYEFMVRKSVSIRMIEADGSPLFFLKPTKANVDQLRSYILTSASAIKTIQLVDQTTPSHALTLAFEMQKSFAKAKKRVVIVSTLQERATEQTENPLWVQLPDEFCVFNPNDQTLLDSYKANNDLVVIINRKLTDSSELFDFAPQTDLTLCLCTPDVTTKETFKEYSRWRENRLFNRLEMVVTQH